MMEGKTLNSVMKLNLKKYHFFSTWQVVDTNLPNKKGVSTKKTNVLPILIKNKTETNVKSHQTVKWTKTQQQYLVATFRTALHSRHTCTCSTRSQGCTDR